jgi:PAS domain S-box-containing protein
LRTFNEEHSHIDAEERSQERSISHAVVPPPLVWAPCIAHPFDEKSLIPGLIQHFPTGSITLFDTELNILFTSSQISEPAGHSRDLSQVRAFPDPAAHAQYLQLEPFCRNALHGKEVVVKHEFNDHFYQSRIIPVCDGNQAIWAGLIVTQDVTDHHMVQSLRDREQQYRVLLDNATDMIALHEMDGTFIQVSSGCRSLLGFEPADLVGHLPYDFFHTDDIPAIRNTHSMIFEQTAAQTVAYRMRGADDSWRWVETTCRAIHNSDDVITNIVTVTRDISERQRAAVEREHLLQREQAARATAEAAVARLEARQYVTDVALNSLDTGEFLQELVDRIRLAVGGDRASLFLLTPERTLFGPHKVDSVSDKPSAELDSSVIDQWVTYCKPVIIGDLASERTVDLFASSPTRSFIGAPLLVAGRAIGVIYVGNHCPGRFSDNDLQLLEVVAERAAAALERRRLFDELHANQQQLHTLSGRLLEVQENERRHISRELHDEIGQSLSAIAMGLQRLRNEVGGETLAFQLDECVSLLESTIQQVRTLSVDLRPPVLELLGLEAALREHADRMARHAGFEMHIDSHTFKQRAPADVETACFRVAQEALTNVARHAHASQVGIYLREQTGALQLTIVDNGVGFDVELARNSAHHGKSLGLLSMQERVLLAGGHFDIQSRVSVGTTLTASFKIDVPKGLTDLTASVDQPEVDMGRRFLCMNQSG